MAHEQAFYGRLSSVSPVKENISITTGDFTPGSNQFTIADPFFARIGQTLTYVNIQFTGTVTITNIVGSTVTVDKTANANAASGQTIGLNTPSGTYLFESASFEDPNFVKTVDSITGSQDSEFNSGDTDYYVLGQAANSLGSPVVGRFHLYQVTEVLHRKASDREISAFISWGEDSTETASGDQLLTTSQQTLPIVSLSERHDLAPIYSTDISEMVSSTGADVAGYQIALNRALDRFITFPYTGSAIISGSFGVTGSAAFSTTSGRTEDIILIKGNTADNGSVRVTHNGTLQLNWSGSSSPTAIEGGIYYSSSVFYVGTQ